MCKFIFVEGIVHELRFQEITNESAEIEVPGIFVL